MSLGMLVYRHELRVSEMVALRWNMIDLDQRVLPLFPLCVEFR